MRYVKAVTEDGVEYIDAILYETVDDEQEEQLEWAIDAGMD